MSKKQKKEKPEKSAVDKKVDALKSAFVNEDDAAIEKATRINFKRIDNENLKQVHKRLLDVLEIKSTADSIYYDFTNYKKLVNDIAKDRAARAAAKAKREAEENDNDNDE